MKSLFLLTLVLTPPALWAMKEINHSQSMQMREFLPGGDCGLKKFAVARYDREIEGMDEEYVDQRGAFTATVWETTDPSCLKNYGVVQYIKGCLFNVEHDPQTGSKEKYIGKLRKYKGVEAQPLFYKDWVVDTDDIDPLYGSYEGPNRFFGLRYPKTPFVLKDDRDSLLLIEEKAFNSKHYSWALNDPLTSHQFFNTDLTSPSSFFLYDKKVWVEVASLEYKTCLYHTKDIPLMSDPASFSVPESEGGPIVCFDWENKYQPNYQTHTFTPTKKIDPYCFE